MKVVFDLSVTSAVPHRLGSPTNWDTAWNSPESETAAELILDFAAGAYGVEGTEVSLESALTMQRNSDGTRIDPTGALDLVGPNIARIDHDPVSLGPRGLLLESESTNLLTNSGAPENQTVSVIAVSYVFSFYGTGTITFAGAYSGSFTGTATYPGKTSILLTPASGNLNISFTGEISAPQLEEGNIATSYIPTDATQTTRSHDVASVNLGNWFNPAQGTFVFSGSLEDAQANDRIIEIDTGATSTRMSLLWNTVLGKPQFQVWNAGVLQAAIAPPGNSITSGDHFRVAIAYSENAFAVSLNGGGAALDNVGIVPTGLTTLRIGRSIWGSQGLMTAENLIYYPTRLSNSEIQALSA